MSPDLFAIAAAVPAVTALLGTNPVRIYPAGHAPQPGTPGYALPYAATQTIYGGPYNYLNQTPDGDSWGVQVDCYAATVSAARAVAEALRDALEPHAHILSWRGDRREQVTGTYAYGFDIEFQRSR